MFTFNFLIFHTFLRHIRDGWGILDKEILKLYFSGSEAPRVFNLFYHKTQKFWRYFQAINIYWLLKGYLTLFWFFELSFSVQRLLSMYINPQQLYDRCKPIKCMLSNIIFNPLFIWSLLWGLCYCNALFSWPRRCYAYLTVMHWTN